MHEIKAFEDLQVDQLAKAFIKFPPSGMSATHLNNFWVSNKITINSLILQEKISTLFYLLKSTQHHSTRIQHWIVRLIYMGKK